MVFLNPLNNLHPMGISWVASWTVAVTTETFLDERSLFEAAQLLGRQRKRWKLTQARVCVLSVSLDTAQMRGMPRVVMIFPGFSNSISRRRVDFFCGALAFFLPVGPRCDLRAGGLSLGKQANVRIRRRNSQRIKQTRPLTLPIGFYCC